MTSISVNNAAKSVQTISNGKAPYDLRMTGKNFQADNSFQSAIDLYKKPEATDLSDKVESTKSTSVECKQQYAQKGSAKDRVKESGMDNLKKQKTLSEDEADAVEKAAEEIVSQVAKELNVSEEDVKAALESLGISVFDLGNANQMSALFTEILGMSDSMQIVTDGDLFASLTSLTQAVDDMIQSLQEELQISAEELFAQLNELKPEQSELTSTQEVGDLGMETESDEKMAAQAATSIFDVDSENSVDTKMLDVDEVQSKEMVVTNDTSSAEMSQDSASSELQNQDSENHEGKQNLNQNTFSVFADAGQTAVVEGLDTQNTSYSMVNDIMEQIGDYVKTNVTADVKQMEIQLSPANLGQVHINIASKNGVVTAQITAENEMVKNAIELQVVQLKERLEGQGVRIEAVEVTVASHEFERNLDQNNENRETREEVKKTSSRKWNLSELDGEFLDGEELTDSEQVELDMMKLTGNQLNYMI